MEKKFITVSWRDRKKPRIIFEVDARGELVDYERDKERALRLADTADSDWLVEAFESLNLCTSATVKEAFFTSVHTGRRTARWSARTVTVHCSHSGGLIDVGVVSLWRRRHD